MSRRRRRSRKKRAMRSRTEQAGRGEGGGGADYSGLTRHDRPSRPLAIRGCRKHARAALDIPPCRLQQPTMHPSHVSWPHKVLHWRPQWQGPHAFPHISTSISVHPLHVSYQGGDNAEEGYREHQRANNFKQLPPSRRVGMQQASNSNFGNEALLFSKQATVEQRSTLLGHCGGKQRTQ